MLQIKFTDWPKKQDPCEGPKKSKTVVRFAKHAQLNSTRAKTVFFVLKKNAPVVFFVLKKMHRATGYLRVGCLVYFPSSLSSCQIFFGESFSVSKMG